MKKIGIDPSGTGTTAIVCFIKNKLVDKTEIKNKDWLVHAHKIKKYIKEQKSAIIIIENCLYTSANASKDRDDLLRLLGTLYYDLFSFKYSFNHVYFISPRHIKSVVNKIEYKSKFLKNNPHLNDNFGDIKIGWEKNARLYYEFGKDWFYNNEKISNHLRNAIIIANYQGKNNEN